jgi:hypothetical protein
VEKQRDENGELVLDFPTALAFQMLGEEIKDGHAAYILAATAKPGIVPTTLAAKVLTGIQGKAWVEKDTMHPIRVECSVVKPIPRYGALASVLPGTDIEIGMTKVADSTWLINTVSMKLKVAKVHVFKSTAVTRSTYSDYRLNASAIENFCPRPTTNRSAWNSSAAGSGVACPRQKFVGPPHSFLDFPRFCKKRHDEDEK